MTSVRRSSGRDSRRSIQPQHFICARPSGDPVEDLHQASSNRGPCSPGTPAGRDSLRDGLTNPLLDLVQLALHGLPSTPATLELARLGDSGLSLIRQLEHRLDDLPALAQRIHDAQQTATADLASARDQPAQRARAPAQRLSTPTQRPITPRTAATGRARTRGGAGNRRARRRTRSLATYSRRSPSGTPPPPGARATRRPGLQRTPAPPP